MDSFNIQFWGKFENKDLESKFIQSTKADVVYHNKIGILASGIGYLLVSVADYTKLGLTPGFYFSFGARVIFFLFCLYTFFVLTPKMSRVSFITHSFIFGLGNSILLLFVIYYLNPDKQIDAIDAVTLPFITLMLYVFLQLPLIHLFINSMVAFWGFVFLLTFLFETSIDYVINIIALMFVLIVSGFFLARVLKVSRRREFAQSIQIKQLNDSLKTEMKERSMTQEMLENTYNELKSSIQYARNLQMSLLPPMSILDSIVKENFIYFKPRDIVSGDFYWFNNIGKYSVIAVADCTGHGIPGAFMSILGISNLNKVIKESQLSNAPYTPAEVLEHLKKEIVASISKTFDNDDRKDGMDLSLCIVDNEYQKLVFSGAYSNLWYIRGGQMQVIKGDNMPIGKHIRSNMHFTNHSLELEEGDIVYMCTDGYKDQFGGERGKRFQSKQLRQLFLDNRHKPLSEMPKLLHQTLVKWKGSYDQVDDILILGMKF